MTEVEIELQRLRQEVAQLRTEVAKLKADNGSLESLHYLDQSEIVWLRRLCESYAERSVVVDG